MGWRKKEKPLDVDSALLLARRTAEPFWLNCTPQFACMNLQGAEDVKNPELIRAYPIDPKFLDKTWLMFFLDPFTHSGNAAFFFISEFLKRFSHHKLEPLFVLELRYSPLLALNSNGKNAIIRNLILQKKIQCPILLDHDGSAAKAFGLAAKAKRNGAEAPEGVLAGIVFNKKILLERTGPDWFLNFEADLQKFIWTQDSGTPFLPVFELDPDLIRRDLSRLECGTRFSKNPDAPVFAKPGFTYDPVKAIGEGKFRSLGDGLGDLPQIELVGTWKRDRERLFTSDPTATLRLHCPSPRLSMVCEASNLEMPSKIIFEYNGLPPYEKIMGGAVETDDEGRAYLKAGLLNWHDILRGMSGKKNEVVMRFPFADKSNISIYSICFGE